MNAPVPPGSRPAGPSCYQCRYFAVSWDPAQPYACRLMGFKSRALPAMEVLRVDGQPCQGFVPKTAPDAKSAQRSPAASPTPGAVRVPARVVLPTESVPDLSSLRRSLGSRRLA